MFDLKCSDICPRFVAPEAECNEVHKYLRRHLTISLREIPEQRYKGECRGKNDAAVGNDCNLERRVLIKRNPVWASWPRNLTYSSKHRAGDFGKLFSWPIDIMSLPIILTSEPIQARTSPPSDIEIIKEIVFLSKVTRLQDQTDQCHPLQMMVANI